MTETVLSSSSLNSGDLRRQRKRHREEPSSSGRPAARAEIPPGRMLSSDSVGAVRHHRHVSPFCTDTTAVRIRRAETALLASPAVHRPALTHA